MEYQQVKDMFDTAERSAKERHEYLESNIATIRKVQEQSVLDRKEITDKLNKISIAEAGHFVNCPMVKDLAKFKEDTNDALLNTKFFTKHPNVFVGAVGFSIVILFGTFYSGLLILEGKINKMSTTVNENRDSQKSQEKKADAAYQKELDDMNK